MLAVGGAVAQHSDRGVVLGCTVGLGGAVPPWLATHHLTRRRFETDDQAGVRCHILRYRQIAEASEPDLVPPRPGEQGTAGLVGKRLGLRLPRKLRQEVARDPDVVQAPPQSGGTSGQAMVMRR